MLDETLIVGVLAGVGFKRFDARAVLAGFLLDLERGVLGFEVTENHVGPGLCKHFDHRSSDAARTAGDECRFACQRNHDTPDWKLENRNWKIETRKPRTESSLVFSSGT